VVRNSPGTSKEMRMSAKEIREQRLFWEGERAKEPPKRRTWGTPRKRRK
jgi:hypothetical protein